MNSNSNGHKNTYAHFNIINTHNNANQNSKVMSFLPHKIIKNSTHIYQELFTKMFFSL